VPAADGEGVVQEGREKKRSKRYKVSSMSAKSEGLSFSFKEARSTHSAKFNLLTSW